MPYVSSAANMTNVPFQQGVEMANTADDGMYQLHIVNDKKNTTEGVNW